MLAYKRRRKSESVDEKFCSVKGCFNKYYAKGYCEKHYANNRRHGYPIKQFYTRPIDFEVNDNGCFNCTSHNKNEDGYPIVGFRKKQWLMNRFVYTEMFGEIPENMVIRHTCDNPACINPEHLIIGTVQDNNQDMIERDRHVKGSRCWSAKLDENEVVKIKMMIRDGHRNKNIASKFGVDHRIISNIRHGRRWKHVKI